VDLAHLAFSGNPFTWNNKRHSRFNIKERLDRGLSNHLWVLLFLNAHLLYLSTSASYDNTFPLSTSSTFLNLHKSFKFKEFWTLQAIQSSLMCGTLLLMVQLHSLHML
jgi:hypothetical protein